MTCCKPFNTALSIWPALSLGPAAPKSGAQSFRLPLLVPCPLFPCMPPSLSVCVPVKRLHVRQSSSETFGTHAAERYNIHIILMQQGVYFLR